MDGLVVERYDRIQTPVLERLYQGDFCQAIDIVPEHKYQKEGGPSLKQCFALLREVSTAPVIDVMRMLEVVVYNCPETGLAPLYDIVSTMYYPELSQDMTMRICTEYSSEKAALTNFEQLAEEAGLGKPLVRARVTQMAERVVAAPARVGIAHSAAEKVAALIRQRSEKLIA